jgi:hypothetical protein
MNEKEKAELGAQTFQSFCQQFGENIYAQILLEELFEGIINAEALFIFGEQEQTGHQITNNSPRERSSKFGRRESFGIQPSPSMGEADFPPYP